jgi:hypothetical protein
MKKLVDHIGIAGVAAIALLAAALAFSSFVVRPLEARGLLLQERASGKAPAMQPGADKVAAVYEFLTKEEDTTDWLAKLHGIGTATGVHLKSASYRTQPAEGRIVRTEIVLPVSGSYGQIRDFLKRSLAEIPVLSVDQLKLRRENIGSGGALQAEMKLTLHMVKS